MTLAAGTRLGPYEIVALVGAGGMGEVYRARDTRLDRNVAIKILPPHTADRPEVRQRFEREARTISALHHPHICTLFDIGSQDGIDYLVMEYLEGETLSDRLKKGPLPIEQTLRIAVQAADALDRAHRTGIIHRDLKPGNIMLTKDGAKVMDFGLAKFHDKNAGAMVSGGSVMQTLTSPLTGEGAIVGTLQYMAPEQLEGQEADTRSDIFAFGAVLYETASGRTPFEAKTHAGLIAQIMSNEPASLSAVAPLTPPTLERLVRTCLAKDPAERWQSMHDVLLNLRGIAEGGSRPDAPALVLAPRNAGRRLWYIAAAAILLALFCFGAGWFLRRQPEASVVRLYITGPEKTTFEHGMAISPDGTRLAFVARSASGQDMLWLRPLDSLTALPMTGTEGANFPFWSPDSRAIAFFADGKLKRMDAGGGAAQILCDAPNARGGAWGADGTILLAPGFNLPLHRVSAAGGAPVAITELDPSRSEISHRWPQFLPDGRHFLCLLICSRDANNAIGFGSLGEKEVRILINGSSAPVYSPQGYLLFVRANTLMGQPFDARKLRLSGDPFPIAQDVPVIGSNGPAGYAPYSVSQNGTLTYRTGHPEIGQFTWFDRAGKRLGTAGPPGDHGEPALSPDQRHLVFEKSEGPDRNNLWLLDLTRNLPSRFTFSAATEGSAVWSSDGTRVAFSAWRHDKSQLYQKLLTGAVQEELILNSPVDKFPDDWSPDGRLLLFEASDAKTKADLWILPMDGDRQPKPYLQNPYNESHARISPDGRWVAYASDETGRSEIYVQSFPISTSGRFQVSTDSGDEPMWRSDGKELFFRALDRKLMAVPVNGSSVFQHGTPQVLFETQARSPIISGNRNYYVASGDGRKFLVFTPVESAASPNIVTVLNWTSGLSH